MIGLPNILDFDIAHHLKTYQQDPLVFARTFAAIESTVFTHPLALGFYIMSNTKNVLDASFSQPKSATR